MKPLHYIAGAVFAMFSLIACNETPRSTSDNRTNDEDTTTTREAYNAQIVSLNEQITGTTTKGVADFTIENGNMHVVIKIVGSPANMEHWQHFHGFKDGTDATCVTMDDDANGDGIVDLMETEKKSGTTMVPFNELPAEMDIPKNTYPKSDEDGYYKYEVNIPLEKLQKKFKDEFGSENLELDKRVIFIHGVPSDTNLPESVASLGDIPAHVTLPIACGKIMRVK